MRPLATKMIVFNAAAALIGVAALVVDVPTEGLEERVEKLAPELSFVVPRRLIRFAVALEPLDQFANRFRRRHALAAPS